MAVVWTSRGCGYRFGAWTFLLATVMYVVGFGSPFWTMTGSFSSRHYISSGLWMNCISDNEDLECFGDSLEGIFSSSKPEWLLAVLALQTLGLIGLIIASLYCIVVNFCMTSCTHSRFLEVVGIISGLCGVVSCAVYIVKTQAYPLYSWALGLDLAGCSLALLAAALLWCCNAPPAQGGHTSETAYLQAGSPTRPSPPPHPAAAPGVPPTVVQHGYPPPPLATADSYPQGQLYPALYQQYAGPPEVLPTAPPAPYLAGAAGHLDPPPAYSNHGFQPQELHEAHSSSSSSLRPASAPSYGTTTH